MEVLTLPAATTTKPCIRDYSYLITHIIPEQFFTLVPLPELARRCNEVARKQPRFAEETPVLLAIETGRRAAYSAPHLSSTPLYDYQANTLDQLPEPTRC